MEQTVNLLIVDDRKENLIAMNKLLKPLRANIYQAESGEKALSLSINNHFAVILMDVQMPNMDGFECADYLRSTEKTKNIPIIFVTAINKEQIYQIKGYELGAVDYLSKPVIPEILLSKVGVFIRLEQKRQELENLSKKFQWLNQKNKLLLNCANEGILGIDTKGIITFINPMACELLGDKEDNLIGQHIAQFLYNSKHHEKSIDWLKSDIYKSCLKKGKDIKLQTNLFKQSGNIFPTEINIASIYRENHLINGAVFIFQDITQRRKQENQLIKMAKYDQLTGIANRALFYEILNMSLARSERRKKNTGIMYLDLDGFKQINDNYGHDIGDQLLIKVAERIQKCIRQGDIVARLGGDEFAIVLDDVAQPNDAELVAKKIINNINKPYGFLKGSNLVGVSIGIATSSASGDNPDKLVKAADNAMYEAKKSGKNCYLFDKP